MEFSEAYAVCLSIFMSALPQQFNVFWFSEFACPDSFLNVPARTLCVFVAQAVERLIRQRLQVLR